MINPISPAGLGNNNNNKYDLEQSPRPQSQPQPDQNHSKTVQALRKYLQRKLSSEDSSSELEPGSPSEAETAGPISPRRILNKQKSLDDYSTQTSIFSFDYQYVHLHESPTTIGRTITRQAAPDASVPQTIITTAAAAGPFVDKRYLRTDLCEPVLLSRCTFCDESFELEHQLREHLRESHLNYFLQQQGPTQALDLSMHKRGEELTGSLPNLSSMMRSLDSGDTALASSSTTTGEGVGGAAAATGKSTKKQVKCVTCGKNFSTKWNWKQHQKIHLRENLQAYLQ